MCEDVGKREAAPLAAERERHCGAVQFFNVHFATALSMAFRERTARTGSRPLCRHGSDLCGSVIDIHRRSEGSSFLLNLSTYNVLQQSESVLSNPDTAFGERIIDRVRELVRDQCCFVCNRKCPIMATTNMCPWSPGVTSSRETLAPPQLSTA